MVPVIISLLLFKISILKKTLFGSTCVRRLTASLGTPVQDSSLGPVSCLVRREFRRVTSTKTNVPRL